MNLKRNSAWVGIVLFGLAIASLSTSSIMQKDRKKGKIIYVYDALCGWCYGFSGVMQQLYQKHQKTIDFEVLSGGMVTGERIGPIGEVAPYIKWAYKDVEKATGIEFGQDFLEDVLEEGSTIFTSIPPARALSSFKSLDANQAVPFASAIQKAIYYDGIDPSNQEAYAELAKEFGVDKTAFIEQFESQESLKQAKKEFAQSQQLGVTGFPTVFFEDADGNRSVLCRGYASLETLENKLKTLIK